MAELERVLIVGGGIAGLTLAAALHQRGLPAEIAERSTEWRAVGAGIAVQPNAIRALRSVGIADDVVDAGARISFWDFCEPSGEILCEIDLEDLWRDVGPFIGIERSRLQTALLTAAEDVPSRLGTSIEALTQDDRGVSVRFTDGSTGTYDVVVGADGIDSVVRAIALRGAEPSYTGQMVWRSVAPIRPHGLTKLQFLLGDGSFFGLCPVGDGRTYGFGNTASDHFYDEIDGRRDRLRERFASYGPIVDEYIAAIEGDEQIHCSGIEWVDQDVWHTGRVLLIGDAAHASIPFMGQGGCLAIEDAVVLADVLHDAPNVDEAFGSYVSRRIDRVRWVQQESRSVAEALRLPVDVRNATLRERGEQMLRTRFEPLRALP